MTQKEKDLLQQIMEDRICYHGDNVPPELLENERETAERCNTLLQDIRKHLSEEGQHKLFEYADELSNLRASECDWYYQKGFEDGLVLAKIVKEFETSELISIVENRMKEVQE